MKTFFYDENTIDLFKLLKRQTPDRIYSDNYGMRLIFDYVDFHIAVYPDAYAAASQNKYDEAVIADFQRIDSVFQPNEEDLLVYQKNTINRLWILRTMLYFTNHIIDDAEDKARRNLEIEAEIEPVLADLMRKSTGGQSEVVCHPQSLEIESLNKEFANLVDAGIMLEIDNQLLICFSFYNSFGIVGSVMSPNQIKEDILPFYELIEIV